MSLKVVVDWELCEGNAICQRVAPEVFKVDAQDQLQLTTETPPDELKEKLEIAVRRCPRRAIKLEEV